MITIYNASNLYRLDEKVKQVERKYFAKGPTYKSASKGELLISDMNEAHRINAARKTLRQLCAEVVDRHEAMLTATSDKKKLREIVVETAYVLQTMVSLTPKERDDLELIFNLLDEVQL